MVADERVELHVDPGQLLLDLRASSWVPDEGDLSVEVTVERTVAPLLANAPQATLGISFHRNQGVEHEHLPESQPAEV
jgi:hypothetical protein